MRCLLALALPLLTLAAPEFRLPGGVRPLHYVLDLTVLPERPLLKGRVEIAVSIAQATREIWLNGKDLSVTHAFVQKGVERRQARVSAEDGEFLKLTLDQPAGPGPALIGIDFSARLDDKLSVGAYRRSDGRHWYAFTTFTAIEARRAFPCFDQPEFKTPWSVTLHVHPADVALANAREISHAVDADGLKRVTFAETKPLPSEVVAFAAGPFDVLDDGIAGRNQTPVRLIAPHGRGSEIGGAKGAAAVLLRQLEDYTGVPYPWDKLDHLAILDMPFDAVENPGLITYRDRVLLAKPEQDTPEHRRSLRGTMAHELAHQWFGNLVTQRWWDDVWLSEGFAAWLGVKISDLELPAFQRGIAAVQNRFRMMKSDSRPVRLDMHSRKEMQDVYSGIVYQKAAGVLAMVEHWLGAEPFQQGLQRYLRAHAFSNAGTADLTAAIQAATGIDVAPVFLSYLNQPGFPVVSARCEAGKSIVEQQSKLNWNTPVCIRHTCAVVSGPTGMPACGWPNADGIGYYRSQTPDLPQILKTSWNELTAPERLSIAQDAALLPAAAQMAALPVLLRDRDPHVVAAAQQLALQLALAPGADPEAIRKLLR